MSTPGHPPPRYAPPAAGPPGYGPPGTVQPGPPPPGHSPPGYAPSGYQAPGHAPSSHAPPGPPPPGYAPPNSPPPGQAPSGYAAPPAYQPPANRKRRAPRSDPGGLVAGLVIAGLGLFFLAGQLEPDIGRFVTLFIGLALLAVFVVRREYGFLVPGSILTGVGIGIALQPHTTADTEGGVTLLALAGGFLGIWVLGSLYRLPQNHWWPLIPGGILTLIGLVQLSRADVGGAIRLWPIILIVLGAIVVGRALQRRT